MQKNPKFDKFIKDKIHQAGNEGNKDRFGVVLGYDAKTNTATVLLSSPSTESIGGVIENVPCPVTMGVQGAAPEAGRPCYVVFKGTTNENNPMITHFFNHNFQRYDYGRHSTAVSGVPSYILST